MTISQRPSQRPSQHPQPGSRRRPSLGVIAGVTAGAVICGGVFLLWPTAAPASGLAPATMEEPVAEQAAQIITPPVKKASPIPAVVLPAKPPPAVATPGAATIVPLTLPDLQTIVSAVRAAPQTHPRLFANTATFERMRDATDKPAAWLTVRKAVIEQAEAALGRPPLERKLQGIRLLDISREALLRICALSAAFQLTGDHRFADKAIADLDAAAAFSDWNPQHFLDTAEMTLAVAIGYDWLYAELDEPRRQTLRLAIIEKGLRPSFNEPKGFWVEGTNNWTQVCHAGLLAGALVVQEADPELAGRTVHRALGSLAKAMPICYSATGNYREGALYWGYGTHFNLAAIEALRSVLGQDFGLSTCAGIRQTGDYVVSVHGPTGVPFNYSDSVSFIPDWQVHGAAMAWLDRENGVPWEAPTSAQKIGSSRDSSGRMLALGLCWSLGGPVAAQPKSRPLDYAGNGLKPVISFRSAWGDPQAVYLGVIAGSPGDSHGHMDVGSFIFEAQGIRWAHDLGADNYARLEKAGINLWTTSQDSTRWKVYRLGLQSHNAPMLPAGVQRVAGRASMKDVQANVADPHCTIDLTPVYEGQATAVERRYDFPARSRVKIQDRITGLTTAGSVRWQMLTKAEVEVDQAAGRFVLRQGGKQLEIRVTSSAPLVLSKKKAKPAAEYEMPNPGMWMLSAEVQGLAGGAVDFTVELIPATQP